MENPRRTTGELIAEASSLLTILEATITAERRSVQTDRLRVLEEIAGGVAHEINQPLTAILGVTELLLREMRPDADGRDDIEMIHECGKRIREIVRNMRAPKRYATIPYTENARVVDFSAACGEERVNIEEEPKYTHIRPINVPELRRTLAPLLGEQTEDVVDCVQWWVKVPKPVRQALRKLCVGWQ